MLCSRGTTIGVRPSPTPLLFCDTAQWSLSGDRSLIDILTHGVTKSGPAWRPFPGVEVFEEHLKEIRELYDAGVIDVALYRDTID